MKKQKRTLFSLGLVSLLMVVFSGCSLTTTPNANNTTNNMNSADSKAVNQNIGGSNSNEDYIIDGKSADVELEAGGSTKIVWVKIRNTSQSTWVSYDPLMKNINLLRMGTAKPYDRNSSFYVQNNWLATNRVHWADEKTVAPGELMSFGWQVAAPANMASGQYNECFSPIIEQIGWLRGREICWNFKVSNKNVPAKQQSNSVPLNQTQPKNQYYQGNNSTKSGSTSGGYSYPDYSYDANIYGYDAGNYGYDYGYGYDTGNYGYDSGYYGGYDQSSQDYANQTYQDIYESRAATNQEINDNTSQWLYEGEANYINPETGELESQDYTQGNDWYQDSSGDQWQTSDTSYTPEYSTETQMEQYGGWASDYSASDYGYDSGSSYDYGGDYSE